jgi:micrococcal nuclease
VPAQPVNTLEGLVVGVAEGDRLTVNSFGTEINVRLYGVAAPQTAKVDKFTGWYKAGQPYADDAFRALSLKVLHQQVKVQIRKTLVFKSGEPKQIAIAIIFLDGRNINLEMLSDGWGWAHKEFMYKADLPQYLAAQKQARSRKSGLWFQDKPQPPWDFKPELKIKTKHH